MEVAIYALERNRRALGRPRLVHPVAGMLPAGDDARQRILDELGVVLEQARARVNDDLGTSRGREMPPDLDIVQIEYAPRIVENEGRLVAGAAEGYRERADRLVPSEISVPVGDPEPGWVREVLREARIPVAQAEHENFERLAELFTSTKDLDAFVRHEVCLILGAKGTGKTYLRRMCLEHKDLLLRRSAIRALENPRFVDGYAAPYGGTTAMPPLNRDVMRKLAQAKGHSWTYLWSALALGRALKFMKSNGVGVLDAVGGRKRTALARLVEATSPTAVCREVENLAREPLFLDEIWDDIDRRCSREGKTLTLSFDDLDVALGETAKDLKLRKQMIQGLLDRTAVSWVSRRHLAAKVFLREDIFRALDIEEEEAKYATRRVVLNWTSEDIWRLAIRAMAASSRRFESRLIEMGIDRDRLEESTEEQRDAALALIWGDRMGEGESNTRSKAWVWRRLHDGVGRMFPRAALWLLRFAVEERQQRIDDRVPLLDAASLRAAIPKVARERLAELKKECTRDEWRRIELLKGIDSYQDKDRFVKSLQRAGERDPVEALKTLESLGIVEMGSRRTGTPTVRVVDLYALAEELDISRLGRR